MIPGKKSLMVILFLFVLTGFSKSSFAVKSVYVIADTQTSKIFVYKVNGTNLSYQTQYTCELDPLNNAGAVGIAIDRGIRNFPPEP